MKKAKKIIFGIIFFGLAASFLGTTVDYDFSCDKAKYLCEYKTNTLINRTLKTEKIYNLNDFESVEYTEYKTIKKTRKGNTKTTTNYEAVIFIDGGNIVFPIKFPDSKTAMSEVKKLAEYLNNDEQFYSYRKENGSIFITVLILLFVFLGYKSLKSIIKKEVAVSKTESNQEERKK